MVTQAAPKWRNRQTRYVQGVVLVGGWEFESPLRHNWIKCSKNTHEMRPKSGLICVLVTNWSHSIMSASEGCIKQSIKPGGGFLLHMLGNMTIAVQRYPYVGMAQS